MKYTTNISIFLLLSKKTTEDLDVLLPQVTGTLRFCNKKRGSTGFTHKHTMVLIRVRLWFSAKNAATGFTPLLSTLQKSKRKNIYLSWGQLVIFVFRLSSLTCTSVHSSELCQPNTSDFSGKSRYSKVHYETIQKVLLSVQSTQRL